MTRRLKIFVQVMMAFLALDFSSPEAICSSYLPPVAKSNCCCSGTVCACHHNQVGNHSCNVTGAPSNDKTLPSTKAYAPALRIGVPIFTVHPDHQGHLAALSALRHCEPDVSPPSGGSSPQAVLRVWLI